MITINIKLAVTAVFLGGVVIFASIRVWPYIDNGRGPAVDPAIAKMRKVVVNTVVPSYDFAMTDTEVDELSGRIRQKVYAAILDLPDNVRPSQSHTSSIASVYSQFVLLNRTGTLKDALDRYEQSGAVPDPVLVQQDIERAKDAWLYSTAWAKHQRIDVESIRVEPVYISGERITPPRYEGYSVRSRPMSTGNRLVFGADSFTVYEVILSVVAPNLDGKSEFPVEVCVSIINDGQYGKWSVVSITWSKVPDGKLAILPYP